MKTLIVASNNKGKINEIKQILGGLFNIMSMGEAGIKVDVAETGLTFEENAVIKAIAIYRLINSEKINPSLNIDAEKGDIAVLSDDSGLSVDVLGGSPGVYSARYSQLGSDKANNQKLLLSLKGETNRNAKFISAIALVRSEDDIVIATGQCDGKILEEARGEDGFGYDPLFYSFDLKKTFGEAGSNEKNTVSHRARALKNLLKQL